LHKQQLSELDSYIGSKQERRDKKRKHTVMELFNTHSRRRTKHDADKIPKKEEAIIKENGEASTENKIEIDSGTSYGPCYDPGTDLLKGFEANPSKIKSYIRIMKKTLVLNGLMENHKEWNLILWMAMMVSNFNKNIFIPCKYIAIIF